jgi:ADP-ribose pyrophosphatase YjhB (NUDIX family)
MSGEKFKFFGASYLIVKNGANVLLSLRKNTGFMDSYYGLVAGHIEENESASQACIREAKEEANIDILAEDIKPAHIAQRISSVDRVYFDIYFLLENYTKNINNLEPEKCGGLEWFEIKKLPNNILPYVRDVLTNYFNGIFYSETGFEK